MTKIILIGGLDYRANNDFNKPSQDKNIAEQGKLVAKGFGPDVEMITFRFNTALNPVYEKIKQNPNSPILLFSAGCAQSSNIAQFLKTNGISRSNLYILEAYTVSTPTLNVVNAAVALGVPLKNVLSGPDPYTGSLVTGSRQIKALGRTDHFQSLTVAGKIIFQDFGNVAPSTNNSNTGNAAQTQATTTDTAQTQGGVVEQDKSRGEISGQEGGKSNNSSSKNGPGQKFITQLFEPRLRPTAIEIPVPPNKSASEEFKQNFAIIPFIWYSGYQIEYQHIEYFQLYTAGNLPTLKITFYDSMNLMRDSQFPLDDSRITVFINPRTQQLKPVYMDFKIIKFNVSGKSYTITAVIDANLLYVKKYKSFSNKTSFEALKSIADEVGLGFASNIDDTNDKMIWINPGHKYVDFIEDIVVNSYKSDETYLNCYIDFYYNLTYIDVEKELSRNIREELGIGNIGVEEITAQNKEIVQKLVISNDKAFKDSNGYFKDYRIINNSTSISLREGYQTKLKYYNEINKEFLTFDLDTITNDADNKIVLKGQPQDENFTKENIDFKYLGKLDNDNMYQNYHYSFVQNNRNLIELNKISMEVTMKTPNYNFYRFQKILVVISNQAPNIQHNHANSRLSGEWLIVDITYRIESRQFIQILKLIKKELELSDTESKGEVGQKTRKLETGRGTNPNPTVVGDTTSSTQASPSAQNTTTTQDTTTQPILVSSSTRNDLDTILGTEGILNNDKKQLDLVAVDGQPVWRPVAAAYLDMKEAAKKDGINLSISSVSIITG